MNSKKSLTQSPHRSAKIIIFAIALVLLANVTNAGTITLIAEDEADAFIMNGNGANTNWGLGFLGFSPAAVGQQNSFTGNQIGRQLYRFKVPTAYTDLGPIISVSLQLKTNDNFAGIPCNTAVYGLSDSWDEMTVTWNTQPGVDSPEIDSVLIKDPPWPFGKVFEYDVTRYVKSQVLVGDSLFSFEQRGEDETVVGGVRWWQREGDGVLINNIVGEQPLLTIVLDAPLINGDKIVHVPEPSNMLLLGSSLLSLFGLRRKFKK